MTFIVLNVGTALSMAGVGIVFGALFFHDRRQQRGYVYGVWVLGLAFAGTMCMTRFAQGSELWTAWVEMAILWGIYAASMGIGSALSRLLARFR